MDKPPSEICYAIGCSGENKSCPGNPYCAILRKILSKPKLEKIAEEITKSKRKIPND